MTNDIPTTTMKELHSVLIRWAIVLAAIGLFAVWATWRMATASSRATVAAETTNSTAPAAKPAIEYWTCTMHPQVQRPEPGACPICGMQLVAKYAGSDEPDVKPVSDAFTTTQHDHDRPLVKTDQAWYRCTMPECGDVGSAEPNSRCPVCGMKRERVDTGGHIDSASKVKLDERARRLAEVETEPVQKRLLFKRIRAVGRVGYDETRYKMVSAWIDGRIDKLFADFTGMTVSQGDHLVEIYSPELLSAQEEYLQALRSGGTTRSAQTDIARRSSEQVSSAARRKLELLGVTDPQIAAIERSGRPQTRLVVHAPIGGTIMQKKAMEGMYVKTGDVLYTIADLSHLWLLVDLYESDLPWVKPFQEVLVTTRSLPGEVFSGQIVFIDPKLDPQTRTVQIRIHVENPALALKPDMWVSAQIDAALGDGGRGAVPAPRGVYVCPMHPWESADKPAICPICEMNMVAVEGLPRHAPPTEPQPLQSVARGAVMQTGERSLVYVETAPGVYRGVEVSIGPLAQDESGREYYPILGGLRGDEHVVTRGNFAIDSQMQLAGKPSLFSSSAADDQQGEHSGHSSDLATTDHSASDAAENASVRQTRCPVMGGEIDPDVFTDYKGVRIHFCCPPCVANFAAEPDKYIPALPEAMRARLKATATQAPISRGADDD